MFTRTRYKKTFKMLILFLALKLVPSLTAQHAFPVLQVSIFLLRLNPVKLAHLYKYTTMPPITAIN